MSELEISSVAVNGHHCRVWQKGAGAPIGYLAGLAGLPKWPAFAEALAVNHKVIAPSIPGFPGAEGHRELDTTLDWIVAMRELLNGANLEGPPLVGVSIGATLAAEVAAMWPHKVDKLVLVAPFGMYDELYPTASPWAQQGHEFGSLFCKNGDAYSDFIRRPNDADPVEWPIEMARAREASARLLWPMGDTRIIRRLHRIICPTLIVWGADDRLIPKAYAEKFAEAISGPTEIVEIPDAGHLVDLDQPEALAEEVLTFLG